MRSISAFAFPLGSGGRPALLVFFFWLKASKLLRNSGSDLLFPVKPRTEYGAL